MEARQLSADSEAGWNVLTRGGNGSGRYISDVTALVVHSSMYARVCVMNGLVRYILGFGRDECPGREGPCF
jgi:hypothetical protein